MNEEKKEKASADVIRDLSSEAGAHNFSYNAADEADRTELEDDLRELGISVDEIPLGFKPRTTVLDRLIEGVEGDEIDWMKRRVRAPSPEMDDTVSKYRPQESIPHSELLSGAIENYLSGATISDVEYRPGVVRITFSTGHRLNLAAAPSLVNSFDGEGRLIVKPATRPYKYADEE